MAFHFLGGYDKLNYASEGVVQMLKTQSYSPIYKARICGLFDQTRRTKIIDKVREFFGDENKQRFVLLDKGAIEFYYPLSIINTEFSLNLSPEEYQDEIIKFLDSISKQSPYKGQFLEFAITKVELADRVAKNMTQEKFDEIHQTILNLLIEADRLAYK